MPLYSLFHVTTVVSKSGKPRKIYARVQGAGAYRKPVAVRVFQSDLIDGAFNGKPVCLRPLAAKDNTPATPIPVEHVLCVMCVAHLHGQCYGGDCSCACCIIKGGSHA